MRMRLPLTLPALSAEGQAHSLQAFSFAAATIYVSREVQEASGSSGTVSGKQ